MKAIAFWLISEHKITAKFCCHLQPSASTRWTVHWQTLTYRLRPSTRCSQVPPKQLSKLTVCFILMTREIILSNVKLGVKSSSPRDTAISCRERERERSRFMVSWAWSWQYNFLNVQVWVSTVSLCHRHCQLTSSASGPAPETDPLPRQETLTRTLLPVSGLNLVCHGYIFYLLFISILLCVAHKLSSTDNVCCDFIIMQILTLRI